MQTSAKRTLCVPLQMAACALTLSGLSISSAPARAQDVKTDAKATRLLFVSDRDAENAYAVYTMNPDGSDQTRVGKNPGAAFDPVWSPDHSRIVFASVTAKEMPTSDLFVMKADGSGPTQLVAGGEKTLLTSPAWSPDGKRIAYTRVVLGGDKLDTSVYVADSDGKNTKKLAVGLVPVWSPDGKQILFSTPLVENGVPTLSIMDADGTNIKTLTPKGFGAAFSPDGKRIAFVSEGDGRPNIFVMDADGSHITQLTKDPDRMGLGPVWSPDGKHILFSRLPKDNQGRPKLQVCQMDPDGNNVKPLTEENSFIGVGTSILFVLRAARK